MNRSRTAVVGACALLLLGAIAVAGMLQSQPSWPNANAPETRFRVPPGIYTALVFAAPGSGQNTSVTATLSTGGEGDGFPLAVQRGTTTVIPCHQPWSLGQEASIKVSGAATALHVWGMTTSGPVAFPKRD